MTGRAAAAAAAALSVLATAACAPARTASPGVPQTTSYAASRRAAGIPDCPPTASTPAVPGGLPDVSLECLGGTSWVRLAGLDRKPTVVVTWAQWCDPCRQESPLLARVLPAYGDALGVVMVNVSDPQLDRAIDFAKAAGIARWPVIVDPDWALQTGTGTPKVLPVTYFVGADGVIVDKHVGGWSDDAALRAALHDKLGVSA